MGCSPESLRSWVAQKERDDGKRAGLSTTEKDRLKELEREVRALRRANEILRKASALFSLGRNFHPRCFVLGRSNVHGTSQGWRSAVEDRR